MRRSTVVILTTRILSYYLYVPIKAEGHTQSKLCPDTLLNSDQQCGDSNQTGDLWRWTGPTEVRLDGVDCGACCTIGNSAARPLR